MTETASEKLQVPEDSSTAGIESTTRGELSDSTGKSEPVSVSPGRVEQSVTLHCKPEKSCTTRWFYYRVKSLDWSSSRLLSLAKADLTLATKLCC